MEVFYDFLSGYVGGLSGVIIGHPFDTVKVYLQTNKGKGGAIKIVKTIIRDESVKGLFKGMTYPLFGTAFLNSILFGVNSACTKGFPEELRSTARCQFMTGAVAGFSQTIVTCPIEFLKIKMQIADQNSEKMKQNNVKFFKVLGEYFKKKNGIRMLYKGMAVTLMRDIPGFEKDLTHDMLCTFFAGGVSGVASWIPSYPFDAIKTRIQANNNPNICTRFIPFVKHTLKNGGIAAIQKGMLTTLIRAFPVNAFTFGAASLVTYFAGNSSKFKV